MKLQTSPLFWDLDAGGNDAPQIVPSQGVTPVTFNLSGLDGRTEDLWNYIQATWLHVNFTVDQTSGATECPRDKLFAAIQGVNMKSQILGDVLAAQSNDGPALGLIDQVVGAGYQFPVPFADEISNAGSTTNCDMYLRIPHELDVYGRPADGGIWAPILEKGKLVVNIAPAATSFQTGTTLANSTVTVKSCFEISPGPVPQLHAPSKFVRYEFDTSGTQLKLESFGSGDGMLGVNPGARLAMLLWLSDQNSLGGVDGIDQWAAYSLPWRHQKVTNNPDITLASFLATIKRGAGTVAGAGTPVLDFGRWPYAMSSTDVGASLLDAQGLFMPLVWPGQDMNLSASQKQVGDLQILAQWGVNPDGTHVFRTSEQYSWQASMIAKLMGLMGYDTKNYTCEPKTHDNTDPRLISDGQLWGLPLRVIKRSMARKPVI